ncbi:MAG: hypothetical protein PHV30_04785 [Candidatus Margulisbacteria bacterium]|nr:hypothetical protein [Candidatus Margulisiibacteriota bacterium]
MNINSVSLNNVYESGKKADSNAVSKKTEGTSKEFNLQTNPLLNSVITASRMNLIPGLFMNIFLMTALAKRKEELKKRSKK